MNRGYKKNRPASKPNLSFEYAEDKVNILSFLQGKQEFVGESESSSTESMKWVGRVGGNKLGGEGFGETRDRGIGRFGVGRDLSLGIFNGEGNGGLGSGSKKGRFVEESEETVVKNFEELGKKEKEKEKEKEKKKKRISGSLGGREELSKSMLEILRKQDVCESSKEILRFRTRLQVLKAFRHEFSGDLKRQ